MGIQEIPGQAGQVDPVKGTHSETTDTVKGKEREGDAKEKKDSVEVSQEARVLYDAEQTRRFQIIREKIHDGFYLERDVTEKVVDALLKDLKKTP
jgi:anti-sigma28 factor (negative regulator of flagellin synthesis)